MTESNQTPRHGFPPAGDHRAPGAEEWAARALETAGAGVLVADRQGRIVVANALARSWLGATDVAELRAHPLGQVTVLAPDQDVPLPSDELPMVQALRGLSVEGQEIVLVHPAGSRRRLSANATPIRDPAGAVAGAVVVGWDVTAIRDDETRALRTMAQMSAMAAARHDVLADDEPRSAVTRAIVDVTGAACATIMEVSGDSLEVTAHAGGDVPPLRLRLDRPSVPRDVLDSGRPRVVDETSQVEEVDAENVRLLEQSLGVRLTATCWVPVLSGERVVGVLSAAFTTIGPGGTPDPTAVVNTLQLLGVEAASAIERADLRRRLTEQALTDELTGLANLRSWRAALARMPRRGGIAILDLDHFKWVNDRGGHAAGDTMLAEFAQALLTTTRAEDLVARIGGEEFAVLCPLGDDVAILMARIRDRWAEIARGHPIPVTFSAGVAARLPEEPPDRTQVRADVALYAAKQAGRDRCVVAGTDPLVTGGPDPWPALR